MLYYCNIIFRSYRAPCSRSPFIQIQTCTILLLLWNIFWMAILLDGRCQKNANLNFTWTWIAPCLKSCLYDKILPFFCFLQNFFFNNNSLVSNLHHNIFYLNFLKKGTIVLIRAITDYKIDLNFSITLGEKYESTKVETGKKYFTKVVRILR